MINREVISVKGELYLVYRKLKDEEKWDIEILHKSFGIVPMHSVTKELYSMCKEIETINYQEQ